MEVKNIIGYMRVSSGNRMRTDRGSRCLKWEFPKGTFIWIKCPVAPNFEYIVYLLHRSVQIHKK